MMEGGVWRSSRVVDMYRVVTAAPSVCMAYRSSCRRWVMRTLGAVSSYTSCGVGEVACDGDLGGVVVLGGGVGDDVVGRPFVGGGCAPSSPS